MRSAGLNMTVSVALSFEDSGTVVYRCRSMERHRIRANMHTIFRHVGIEGCRAYAEFVNALYRKAN